MVKHICLLHFVKSTLWITVFIVRVGCIIEAYASPQDLGQEDFNVKGRHSAEALAHPNSNVKKKGDRSFTSRSLKSSEDLDLGDTCTGKKDKYYPNYSSDCTSYYFCAAGYQITYLCKPGSRFNGDKCTEDYECPVAKKGSNPCAGARNGYYADSRNAQKYYYCYHGAKAIELSCAGGKSYDSNQKKCVGKEEGRERSRDWDFSTCGGEKKGFYPDLASGCTKYYYCIGEEKTELECAHGALFNGDICVQEAESNFVCPKATEGSSPRTHRSSGS